MSDFKAEPLFKQIEEGLAGMDDKEKKDIQKKVSKCVKDGLEWAIITPDWSVKTRVFPLHSTQADGAQSRERSCFKV